MYWGVTLAVQITISLLQNMSGQITHSLILIFTFREALTDKASGLRVPVAMPQRCYAGEVVPRYRTIGRALLGRRGLPSWNRTVAARGPGEEVGGFSSTLGIFPCRKPTKLNPL